MLYGVGPEGPRGPAQHRGVDDPRCCHCRETSPSRRHSIESVFFDLLRYIRAIDGTGTSITLCHVPYYFVCHYKMGPTKSRKWAYTHFVTMSTPDEHNDDVERLKALNSKVHVCGLEKCPETGKFHLQGYINLVNPVNFSYWKNQFPKTHVEIVKGTEADNVEYCRKGGQMVIDRGYVPGDEVTAVYDCPPGRKNRESMEVIAKIAAGANYRQLMAEHPWFMFWYGKLVKDWKRDVEYVRDYDQDPVY